MKKLITLVLTLILVFTLTACGDKKDSSTSGGTTDPDTLQQETGNTSVDGEDSLPDDLNVSDTPAVTVSIPENLKLTYSINGDDTRTVIKIGDDYYSAYMQHGTDLIETNSFIFKHNSDGTWTQYTYNSCWQATSTVWTDPADGYGGLKSSNFYWHVLLETEYIGQYGNPVENTTVLSRPVKMYEGWADTTYYVDDETGLVIKGSDGTTQWEITEWDTTVTDFGEVQMPE